MRSGRKEANARLELRSAGTDECVRPYLSKLNLPLHQENFFSIVGLG